MRVVRSGWFCSHHQGCRDGETCDDWLARRCWRACGRFEGDTGERSGKRLAQGGWDGCGISDGRADFSDGRADFSDKTNWQPYDRAVIFSDTGERPKKWVRDFGRSCDFFGQD